MKTLASAVLFGLTVTAAISADYDLDRCVFTNGAALHPKACESLRKREREISAANERGAAMDAQLKIEREKHKAEHVAIYERQKLESQEREQKRLAAIEERQLAIDSERRKDERQYALQAKAASERTAKQKSICGEDYRSPRVGMTLARAKECVAEFKLKGQINRADGVVSTYRAGDLYAHVMDGKIVSWGR